jgi:hypothetical protein
VYAAATKLVLIGVRTTSVVCVGDAYERGGSMACAFVTAPRSLIRISSNTDLPFHARRKCSFGPTECFADFGTQSVGWDAISRQR